ncbi:S-adenosylmethionine-dependent methyltransferase [Melia azedarach]|uniref:S-adenosylmethionine-dependent methyltransferase n=1 Tax=Melia azedarach TaxID=155640 RepID=A0ACC1Y1V6_MELAZ|nr:S-adenosylmethionine-dependent methyltransferase [Melia azedarach]
MASPKAFTMAGGDAAYSYAKNSSYQRSVVDAGKELIKEAISEKFDLKSLGFDTPSTVVIKIADLGCSVGPNTFFAMENIIEAVEMKFLKAKNQNPSALEFQVFFNDHYENDFNTLFKTLPPSRKYFAAGVPGSFHGRLFPQSSLHFAHISYALHWLSKVPKEVADRNSSVRNKSSVYNSSVAEAYSTQFKNDMECFLNARAEELVPGGLMFISAAVRPDGFPVSNTSVGVFYEVFGSCLNDLVKMGVLGEEKVNSFNWPAHQATPKELEAIFKRNGKFSIEKMEKLADQSMEKPLSLEDYVLAVRAVSDGLIRNHFGDESAEQIFNHFTTKAEENFSKILGLAHKNLNVFILLKRIE